MKNIKLLFTSAFIFFINVTHAQTVAPSATPTVALTASPTIAPAAENPYGLAAVLVQGDWVAKTTLLLLIIMSLASWYVLISKLLVQQKLRKMAAEAENAFAKASNMQQGVSAMDAASPYRFIVESSLAAVKQHPTVAGQVDLNTWAAQNIERSVATIQGNSQQGLAVLATVGSTAPFVGLFGTVWGIYNALVKIGASGQASIDKVWLWRCRPCWATTGWCVATKWVWMAYVLLARTCTPICCSKQTNHKLNNLFTLHHGNHIQQKPQRRRCVDGGDQYHALGGCDVGVADYFLDHDSSGDDIDTGEAAQRNEPNQRDANRKRHHFCQ
jgi:biopolymer transport protein ExbB